MDGDGWVNSAASNDVTVGVGGDGWLKREGRGGDCAAGGGNDRGSRERRREASVLWAEWKTVAASVGEEGWR